MSCILWLLPNKISNTIRTNLEISNLRMSSSTTMEKSNQLIFIHTPENHQALSKQSKDSVTITAFWHLKTLLFSRTITQRTIAIFKAKFLPLEQLFWLLVISVTSHLSTITNISNSTRKPLTRKKENGVKMTDILAFSEASF